DAFVREMPDWFRLDRTAAQEHALYVAAEKDTLRQQLTGWLAPAGIPVLVVRGFGSQLYADVVHARDTADPRDAVLLVVGDFDCSGEDIERDRVARTGLEQDGARAVHPRPAPRLRAARGRGQARRPQAPGLRPPLRLRPQPADGRWRR
ncbi:hypothetical protein ACFT36_36140, partial [Streptomyces arboris]